ncbi:MAG TPA: hypothetical protein VGH54_21255 [Mycobacterium sp.]|jgi:hypothetical protein|uniref:hypothetical protein n=1 Tax=Mycobacterium sp. TaxID=1785 RepID=UPI002F3E9649
MTAVTAVLHLEHQSVRSMVEDDGSLVGVYVGLPLSISDLTILSAEPRKLRDLGEELLRAAALLESRQAAAATGGGS